MTIDRTEINDTAFRVLIDLLKRDRHSNDHTGAMTRLVTSFAALDRYVGMAKLIAYEHGRCGYLTPELSRSRAALLEWAISDLRPILGEDRTMELEGAF